MISDERLAVLRGQVQNNGHYRHTVERMAIQGVPMGEHGPMIAVTVAEMRALLDAYLHSEKGIGHE